MIVLNYERIDAVISQKSDDPPERHYRSMFTFGTNRYFRYGYRQLHEVKTENDWRTKHGPARRLAV